ncbi:hypothetical protein U1Q18_050903 [Sarracenia purpurea var. burkii]
MAAAAGCRMRLMGSVSVRQVKVEHLNRYNRKLRCSAARRGSADWVLGVGAGASAEFENPGSVWDGVGAGERWRSQRCGGGIRHGQQGSPPSESGSSDVCD